MIVGNVNKSTKQIFSPSASFVCLPRVKSCQDEMDLQASFWQPSSRQWTTFGICEPAFQRINQACHHSIQASDPLITGFQQVQWHA